MPTLAVFQLLTDLCLMPTLAVFQLLTDLCLMPTLAVFQLLTDLCLMPTLAVFQLHRGVTAIFKTRTSLIIYQNYTKMRERMGQQAQRLLTATVEVWRVG